ncbi:Paraneoplastic antigen-like protein 5 [Lemmus lemmus]
MVGDLSCIEGQDGQGQDKAPHRLLIRNYSDKQKQAPPSSVTTISQAHGEYQKKEWKTTIAKLQGDPDSRWDASESEDKGSEAGDSDLRMPTGTEARQGLEEPITRLSWPERTNAWGEVQQGREAVLRRGGRRIQPVFRIIYTALGEPHEGSTLESFRE